MCTTKNRKLPKRIKRYICIICIIGLAVLCILLITVLFLSVPSQPHNDNSTTLLYNDKAVVEKRNDIDFNEIKELDSSKTLYSAEARNGRLDPNKGNANKFTDILKSGPNLDIDDTFQNLVENFTQDIPTHFTNIKHLIQVKADDFGNSENEKLQWLIEQHNERIIQISEIHFQAMGRWYLGGTVLKDQFTVDFDRKQFNATFSFKELDTSTICKNGNLAFSDVCGEDCSHLYYLLMIATFDPEKFQISENCTIKVKDWKYTQENEIDVYKVQSSNRILYFGQEDNYLKRITLLNNQIDYLHVDLIDYIELGKKTLPLNVRLTFTNIDKGPHLNPAETPDKMEMEIEPKSINF